MQVLIDGRYRAGVAQTQADIARALALRSAVFRSGGNDRDAFDDLCAHLIVIDPMGKVVACARVQTYEAGQPLDTSYAAQFYDLERVSSYPSAMMEIGRFCLDPKADDPEIVRVIWSALAKLVDAHAIALLFGCTSFPGAAVGDRAATLRNLVTRYPAPDHLMPGQKGKCAVDLTTSSAGKVTPHNLPPLLRTYLAMGAWVSDHVVCDMDLDTLHIFTGLEIAAMSEARKKLLRALG